MKFLAELNAVEEQQVRAQGEVEGPIGEGKCRQFCLNVSTVSSPLPVVVEESLHRRHPNLAKLVDRANRTPHELVTVAPSLVDYLVVRRNDSLPNLHGFPAVD